MWLPTYAAKHRFLGAKDNIKRDMVNDESFSLMGVGGGTQTSADTHDAKDNTDRKALLPFFEALSTAPSKAKTEANKKVEVSSIQMPEVVLKLNSVDATENEHNNLSAANSAERNTYGMPTDPTLLQIKEPKVRESASTKPILRTYDPSAISDAVEMGTAETRAPVFLHQGSNSLVLVILAGFCCIFLLLWGRKKRWSTSSTVSAHGGADAKGPKVHYTQVPDKQFIHCQDDDDEDCDDYEEDTFANDRDSWDDWKAPTFSSRTPLQRGITAQAPSKLIQLMSSSQQQVQSENCASAIKDDAPTNNCEEGIEMKKEVQSIDNLFCQFGMIPMLQKSAVVSTAPADTSATPAFEFDVQLTPISASDVSEVSTLFAAEVDDELNAENEWGEDDEWIKEI